MHGGFLRSITKALRLHVCVCVCVCVGGGGTTRDFGKTPYLLMLHQLFLCNTKQRKQERKKEETPTCKTVPFQSIALEPPATTQFSLTFSLTRPKQFLRPNVQRQAKRCPTTRTFDLVRKLVREKLSQCQLDTDPSYEAMCSHFTSLLLFNAAHVP